MKKEAPLHNDCLQLARWVATTIDPTLPTGRRAHELAIEHGEPVALALFGRHGYGAIIGDLALASLFSRAVGPLARGAGRRAKRAGGRA